MSTPTEQQEPPSVSSNWMTNVVGSLEPSTSGPPESVKAPDAPAIPVAPTAKPDAAPPATAAAAQPAADDDETKWPRSAAEWKEFKKARKAREDELHTKLTERESKLKELEAKVSAIPAGPTPEEKAEVERLRKENEDYSERIRLIDVERHPKFQQHFANRKAEAMGMVRHIVGQERAAEFEQVLNMPSSEYRDAKLTEMVSDLSGMQQSRLGAAINSLESIESERQAEITKAKENYGAMQAQTKAQLEQRKAAAEKVFADTAADMMKNNPAFQKREGDAAWNDQVDKAVAAAKDLVFGGKAGPEQIIKAALHAQAVAPLLRHVTGLMEENTKLQAQVKALTSASPSMQPGAGPAGDGNPQRVEIKHGMTPAEATANWVKSLGEVPGR